MGATILSSILFTPSRSYAQNQGDLGNWTSISNLPSPNKSSGAVVANGHIIVLGGDDGNDNQTTTSTVITAQIEPDGTLGTWSPTTPLLNSRGELAAVFYNGHVYAIGGTTIDNGRASAIPVEYASVNNDGTMGNWNTTSSPLIPRTILFAATHANAIYVVAGLDQNGIPVTTIERSVIQPDGSLAPWQNVGTLPANDPFPSMVINGDYLYLVGGVYNNTGLANVYRARIQNDGTLGSWISEPPLNLGRIIEPPLVANDQIYAIGGWRPENGFQKAVERSEIAPDGSLGNWVTLNDLPTIRGENDAVSSNGFIYVVGGRDARIAFSDVLRAQILSGPPSNHAPTAVAGTSLDTNGNLQLDGSLSSDPDNDLLTYTWQITGESSTRGGQKVSINDLTPGTYTVDLTVSDGQLQSADKTTVGVVTKRSKASVGITIDTMTVNKITGAFNVSGKWDTTNPLFGTIITNPLSRILFELQTAGTLTSPFYGVVGENTCPLTTNGMIFK